MADLFDPTSHTPIRLDAKRYIFNAIWGTDHDEECFAELADTMQHYFQCFEDQYLHCDAKTKTYENVLEVIHLIQRNKTVESIKHESSFSTDGQEIDKITALAAQLWLMLDIGDVGQCFVPGSTQVRWQDGTLKEMISTIFSAKCELNSSVKLEKLFTACNLERIGGIRVSWTSNLADHLLMKEDDTRVCIFHHATFLGLHKEPAHDAFPSGFIDETLRTLSLLFPPNNSTAKKWFQAKQKQLGLDSKASRCGHLDSAARQIEKFRYWRDRLVILKQAFDDSEPKTIEQWWNDDRKKVQWYTFWIAALILLLTVVFGLIQSLTGIIQAWASVQSLHKSKFN